MSTIKITCDDGIHAKTYIDGEPVKKAVSLSLGIDTQHTPFLVIEELTEARGATRSTTEWALGSFTLVAETPE